MGIIFGFVSSNFDILIQDEKVFSAASKIMVIYHVYFGLIISGIKQKRVK